MKKPFGLDGATVVGGSAGVLTVVEVGVLTVAEELDLAEPHATSSTGMRPTTARNANLRHDAIGTTVWHPGGAKAAALPVAVPDECRIQPDRGLPGVDRCLDRHVGEGGAEVALPAWSWRI